MAFRITELTSSSNSSKQAHAKSMALALSRSYVPIVHCVAKTTSILRIIEGRFIKFCNSGLMSKSRKYFVTHILLPTPLLDTTSCLVIHTYKMIYIQIMF